MHQLATVNQVSNVMTSRVLVAAGHACPLRRGELALEAIEQAREQLALPFAKRNLPMVVPEADLGQYLRQSLLGGLQGPPQALQKPSQPGGRSRGTC